MKLVGIFAALWVVVQSGCIVTIVTVTGGSSVIGASSESACVVLTSDVNFCANF